MRTEKSESCVLILSLTLCLVAVFGMLFNLSLTQIPIGEMKLLKIFAFYRIVLKISQSMFIKKFSNHGKSSVTVDS